MKSKWDGYCSYCGGLGHRPENCRWRSVRIARSA